MSPKIVGWVMEVARFPVITKLTPNITDVTYAARAAKRAGSNAISLINTINSITQVNLDNFCPEPFVAGKHPRRLLRSGGEADCVEHGAECAADPEVQLPISGIGGITTWRDAEFIALGSTSVQVCTAIMHYGFRIVEDMAEGFERLPRLEGHEERERTHRQSRADAQKWETLDLHYKRIASINYDKCIGCNLCYIACEDGAHPSHHPTERSRPRSGRVPGKPIPKSKEHECVGCNLCSLVCPGG